MTSIVHSRFLSLLFALCGCAALLTPAACASKARPITSAPAPPAATAPAPAVAPAPVPSAPAPPATATVSSASGSRPVVGPPPLTGMVTRAAIESFNDIWKGLRAQDYEPDAAAVASIRENAKDVEVFAVVATWCPDTRRDLPRFFKIADRAGLQPTAVRLLAVDRTKKDADGMTEKWNVTRVPTFIFIRGGREIGRVVERPTTTLEKDVAEILARR